MAEERVWRFEFVDARSSREITSGIASGAGSGIGDNKKKGEKEKQTEKDKLADAFLNKTSGDVAKAVILSPLNSVMGRSARPLYMAGRRIVNGGSIGAAIGTAAGAFAMMGVEYIIGEINKRIDDLQQQVTNKMNADNTLIRAGSVSKETYYTSGFFSGVKRKTDRS